MSLPRMGFLALLLNTICCIDHYGPEGPECFSAAGVIYLNRDHPLYKRETKTRRRHMMHVARLITQEVAMMREPISTREAFHRQSLLLKDSFPLSLSAES